MSTVTKDGYRRLVWEDSVVWYIDNGEPESEFVIARFPFVPDYHLCDWVDNGDGEICERPLQQFKTLAQALAVLRVIEGSQS